VIIVCFTVYQCRVQFVVLAIRVLRILVLIEYLHPGAVIDKFPWWWGGMQRYDHHSTPVKGSLSEQLYT